MILDGCGWHRAVRPSWPSVPVPVSGYRVLARLGSGGMGQVYPGRARSRSFGATWWRNFRPPDAGRDHRGTGGTGRRAGLAAAVGRGDDRGADHATRRIRPSRPAGPGRPTADPAPGPTVAITQGDTGDWFGWVPEIYLLGGGSDDPGGGLPVCTDARAARVT